MRGEQPSRDRSWIARIHSKRCRVDDKIRVRKLHACCRFLPSDSFKARHGAEHASFRKKWAQAIRQCIGFCECAIDQDEAFAVLECALPGNGASSSTAGANYHHPKIAQIDRELAADGTQESFAVGIVAKECVVPNANRVYGSYATGEFIRFIDLPEARNFVRHRQVHSCKVQISQKAQSRSQFIRPDMKARVLSIDLAGVQSRILHFGRKRMCNWITKDAQVNGWIDVACNVTPLLKVA